MSSSKTTVGIISLGCPRNLVDSELILGNLDRKKYKIVSEFSQADVAIVNTCSFIKDAKKESIRVILDLVGLKKNNKLKKIIVCGCLVEQYGLKLKKQFKEVDAFVGRLSLERFKKRFVLTPKHYAYLKITEGCSNNCSYCSIPKIKGRLRSQDPKNILQEVEYFDRKRISELIVIGQDISSYGKDLNPDKINLSALLKLILKKSKHIKWIRLLYLHPRHIDDELIELIKKEKRICKYIDLPIQHINERILEAMNRGVTKKEIVNLVIKLRAQIPGLAIRTSIIVGFPGETDKEFEELLGFIQEYKFERLGAFAYSREEGTRAYDFNNRICESTKKKRLGLLMNRQRDISLEYNQAQIGKVKEVLIDEKTKDTYFARTENDAPEIDNQVIINTDKKLKIGGFVKVKIVDAYEYDLIGELL